MNGTLLWCGAVSAKQGFAPEGVSVKVRVDPEKCQGHNRCYSLAPELFDVDDLGYASAKGDGVVPPDLEGKAKLAAANCPEYAVIIEDEG